MSFFKQQFNFLQILHDSFVMKYTPFYFLGQTLYTLHKSDQSKYKFFRLFGAQIKIHQILVIFETKNKFLFKFCTTLIERIGYQLLVKNTASFFLAKSPPLINRQTVQASLFRQSAPLYCFFVKVGSFSGPPKY